MALDPDERALLELVVARVATLRRLAGLERAVPVSITPTRVQAASLVQVVTPDGEGRRVERVS